MLYPKHIGFRFAKALVGPHDHQPANSSSPSQTTERTKRAHRNDWKVDFDTSMLALHLNKTCINRRSLTIISTELTFALKFLLSGSVHSRPRSVFSWKTYSTQQWLYCARPSSAIAGTPPCVSVRRARESGTRSGCRGVPFLFAAVGRCQK